MDIDFKNFLQVREDGVLMVRENTEKGYAEVMPGGVFDGSYLSSKTRRGRAIEGGMIAPTLTCACGTNLFIYEIEKEK